MNNPISKTPFVFVLIPLVVGIVLQYYTEVDIIWSIIVALLGSTIMLSSFLQKQDRSYKLRWLFGIGVLILFASFGGVSTFLKQQSLDYTLSDSIQTYIGYVTDSPQEKPRSVAYNLYLEDQKINIVCYLQKDSTRNAPEIGDEIAFLSRLQNFKNAGNPNEFAYDKYMYNQGFVGSTYLTSASWISTGHSHQSLKIFALKLRQRIINFFESLGLEGDELAVLSALTLGYQDSLSDDLIQGFRTTGTVHILSVSGLHVGIIYSMISLLLSFISRTSRFYRIRPLLIILVLWSYAFVTGLPASVIRASTMLTVFCIADFIGSRKNSSLNGLYIAAFLMLLYNPFWIFDIGFQLSFISVLSILVLHKKMSALLTCTHRITSYVWNMFCLSIVAQLATFPLCLYYFGTFPTYFFVANLIIVPLVCFITYAVGLTLIGMVLSFFLPQYSDWIYWLATTILRLLVEAMTAMVHFVERMPMALIQNVEISFVQLVLLLSMIGTFLYAVFKYSSRGLIASLAFTLGFVLLLLANDLKQDDDRLIVYNRNGSTDIKVFVGHSSTSLDSLLTHSINPLVELGTQKILVLNTEIKNNLDTESKYNADYIVVTNNSIHSLAQIERYYTGQKLVLDGSLKSHVRNHLTKECENRKILIHDVTKDGALSIIF